MFDFEAWPNRLQYDLNEKRNVRVQVPIGGGRTAYVLSRVWLLREKIITQHQRAGTRKEKTDINDVIALLEYVKRRALVMKSEGEIEALKVFLKRPEVVELLREAIECPAVLAN